MKRILNLIFSRVAIIGLLILIQALWFVIFLVKLKDYATWINGVFMVLSVVMFLIVVISDQNPAYKIGWIVLIGVVPFLGSVLYMIMSHKKPSKKLRRKISRAEEDLWAQIEGYEEFKPNLDQRTMSLVNYIEEYGPFYLRKDTSVKYYSLGDYMFLDMLEDLKKAEKFIFFEYFIVAEGKMWREIRKILVEKAEQGLDVRVMYDDIGCVGVLPKNFKKDLESHNIKVVTFNPLVPFLSLVMNNRDHRKILVIDGNVGYNGGINIGDEYINHIEVHGKWKDTGIRLEGTGVVNLTVMFLCIYNAYMDEKTDLKNFLPTVKVEDAKGYVQPYSDSPLDFETVAENVYIDILYQAKDYCYIFTPYLIIDNEMTVALQMAAKRGVDVRIVVPKIPDKKTVYHLGESYFKMLLKAGVKIYRYTPGFIHAKSYVSDDKIAVVGTINMDYRSLYLHFECGTLLFGNDAIMDLKNDCLETFKESEEVRLDNIRTGEIWNLYEAVLRILSPLF